MDNQDQIIRDFLSKPLKRDCFNAYFTLCHGIAIGYLKYCRGKGYRLAPGRQDQDTAFSELALTLLGELFRCDQERPFAPVFDYYNRQGLPSAESMDDGELLVHTRTLVCGYLKKQLYRFRQMENRQAEVLKRRIKDILQPPLFIRIVVGSGQSPLIAMSQNGNAQHSHAPVPLTVLREAVRNAYVFSKSRSEWCTGIFRLVDKELGYPCCIPLYDLIELMVAANTEALQELGPPPADPAQCVTESERISMDRLIQHVLDRVEREVLGGYLQKGRIQPEEATAYLQAAGNYLRDLGYCGDNDKIPKYFREVMPPEKHALYIPRHKHPFEMVIAKSVDYFRSGLKEKLI
ncbi:MAG: hypothetical protein R3F48_02635 [Candidatus Zixiibacteriota bacterium]